MPVQQHAQNKPVTKNVIHTAQPPQNVLAARRPVFDEFATLLEIVRKQLPMKAQSFRLRARSDVSRA
ncbi:hypothetical protein [Pelagicoccus sp. SDUM812005]|uniref:hypothetical protein n=1 Tax=Pelagicoccus sp. SDUM812005 TaxID=3041257 RepID=UPI00280C505B|nr:hypothetical protein [Pelagicoccus sp. SDUM812005]MDQ8181347.1 hypothetical protein [Pelagicoccus sp. SDUM812005]